MNNTHKELLKRYQALQIFRIRNTLTPNQQTELIEICSILLDQLLKDNSHILKRLKVSDYENTGNRELIKKYQQA